MESSHIGIVTIRRSWTEEGVQLAIGFVVAMIAIFGYDKHVLAWIYVPWTVLFLAMNRRQGIDLTPDAAVIRGPFFLPARTIPRDRITDVAIANGFVALHVQGAKRPVKVTVKAAVGPLGRKRVTQAHQQIRQWWLDRPAAPALERAQAPGSASI